MSTASSESLRRPLLLSPGLEELRQLEAALEADWSKLQSQGYGFRRLCERLADPGLSEAERSRMLGSADRVHQEFLDRLDDFLRRQHSHFMEQVVAELDHAMKTMDAFYGRRRIRRVFGAYRRLKRLADRCRELEPMYGTAGDHRRIATYQRFYAGALEFSRRIRRLDPTMPRSAPRSLVDRFYRIRRGRRWVFSRLFAMGRLALAIVRILRTVLAKAPARVGTPFTHQVDALFGAWGELAGYEVRVSGEEHIPRSPEEKAVYLFTPAHRHGVTDNVTFSHLNLKDYMVFNAVDQLPVVPQFLKDRIANTSGLIPVGKGRSPSIDCALDALGRGVSRNILIYPEGSVSEGLGGTRPPRRNFGEGVVRRIREAGYRVYVVPVTYPDNARFLDLPPRSAAPEDRRLRVVVSHPLDPPMIDALLTAGGGEPINRMVRLAWLEEFDTDDRRLLGQDRIAEIERRLDAELDGARYWGSIESAPVADRLETRSGDPIEAREEAFHGKRLQVLQIPETARNEEGKIVLENLRQRDSNELLIGIRAPSHIYLYVGRKRFDGDIFRPLSVKERDYVYAGGILVRFVDIPVKSLNAIRRKLEDFGGREQRTLTCANSACKVIARAANIKIADHADMRPFLPSHVLATRTIRKLLERGVRNHSGGQVDYQIYKTDSRSLESILAEMRRAEIQIARDHLGVFTRRAYRAVRAALQRLSTSTR